MTSKTIDQSYFYIKDIFNHKKEKRLIINCSECPFTPEIAQNNKCVDCFLEILYLNKDCAIKDALIQQSKILISYDKVKYLLDYFKLIDDIKKTLNKILVRKIKTCPFSEFICDFRSNFQEILNEMRERYLNPLIVYTNLNQMICKVELINRKNELCQNCIKESHHNLLSVLELFQNLEIIKMYKHFKGLKHTARDYIEFYISLYFGKSLNQNTNKNYDDLLNKFLLEEYKIGKSQAFKVEIYSLSNRYEKNYIIDYAITSELERDYILRIIDDVVSNLKILGIVDILPLESLIKRYQQEALLYLKSKYKLSLNDKEKIAFISTLTKINLERIFPLLLDDYVEEIFLDAPNDKIYLNHQKYGRCITDIEFTSKEIERLKTFLRLYSGKRLDFSNPTIKVVLKNKYFYCRFAIDIEPIQVFKFALDIRKLNKNILNIQDLVKNDTLNSKMAAFLYFLILRRVNITTIGETDSGKTTLINALDLITPREFRKIYIENVIESLNQLEFHKHQLKYQVDSLTEDISNYPSKHNQIKNLLHRSPDLIYLGEILTRDEAEAMFHCLSAGLKGFQTIHANSVSSLINRFLFHFKIDFSCLKDLGIIIFMKKLKDKRYINMISEINPNENDLQKIYNPIFKYNSKTQKWIEIESLFHLNAIKQIIEYEYFSEDDFTELIKIYSEIFETLKTLGKLKNSELVNFLDQLSFYSFQGIKQILTFWENWKKTRGLN